MSALVNHVIRFGVWWDIHLDKESKQYTITTTGETLVKPEDHLEPRRAVFNGKREHCMDRVLLDVFTCMHVNGFRVLIDLDTLLKTKTYRVYITKSSNDVPCDLGLVSIRYLRDNMGILCTRHKK